MVKPKNLNDHSKGRGPEGGEMSLEILKKIPVFSNIEQENLERLQERLVRRRYKKGQVLFHMGDEGGSLYILQKGRVKVTIPTAIGDEVILAILSAGEIIGEMSLIDCNPRSATVQAMEETEVICLFREDFLNLLRERFEIVLNLLEILVKRLRKTDESLAESHYMDITSRLAKKIMELGRAFGIKEGNEIRIGVKVTQKDIASMIGATRESINKQLKMLRNSGLVERRNSYIYILDNEGLSRCTGEDAF